MPPQSIAVATDSLLEIDHVLVCTRTIVQPDTFADLGLICSQQAIHRQHQGTVSQLIFFENIYLELISVEDEMAAEIYAMQFGIDFLARAQWQQTQASPFGFALRQKPEALEISPLHLRSVPAKVNQPVANTTDSFINFAADNWRTQTEPLCFVIPEAISLLSLLDQTRNTHSFLSHGAGMQHLTSARVAVASTEKLTDSMAMLSRDGVVEVEQDAEPLLELTFDHRLQRQTLDLRWLGIPVVLNY
jgi:hypothetical protein